MILCAWCNKDLNHHSETSTDVCLLRISKKKQKELSKKKEKDNEFFWM